MIEPLTLSRILEASFGLLSAAAGLVVLLLALRIAPTLTLSSHRRAMQIFVVAASLIVLSELVSAVEPLFRTSTFADVAEEFVELVAISSGGFALYLMGRAEREEISLLRRLANVDELTDLGSRSFFRRAAARRIELSKNNDLPLVCVVLDVDNFKPYNDRYGHEAGDEALRCIARVLHKSTRADDLVARYRGEEFALLLSGDVEDALEVAERIRRGVERECTPERDTSLCRRMTISLGIAPLTESTRTLERLIGAADGEMYHAKRAGKIGYQLRILETRQTPGHKEGPGLCRPQLSRLSAYTISSRLFSGLAKADAVEAVGAVRHDKLAASWANVFEVDRS